MVLVSFFIPDGPFAQNLPCSILIVFSIPNLLFFLFKCFYINNYIAMGDMWFLRFIYHCYLVILVEYLDLVILLQQNRLEFLRSLYLEHNYVPTRCWFKSLVKYHIYYIKSKIICIWKLPKQEKSNLGSHW